ncbi:hypothetical protein SeMB42_g01382 [Synchytrium endobioticum]|uniref:Dynein regulatory complex protein 9 n=1 Tax=Synchytrium endobioticum TaxID=286115 RepID=A0A507DFD1_9FUNG|nr:hypothetical protein SeLEV6574_g00997 [Synchytrium endobioticum]TPX52468.1 hypothetical protein SeMB42_g01385 [Synchytrium endobioticum]TPX52469.1 hypothetical protein SeMB42_g01382 [Synchytrium endobioticum]
MATARLPSAEALCLSTILDDALAQLSVLDDLPGAADGRRTGRAARVAAERAGTARLLATAAQEMHQTATFTSLADAVRADSARRHALQLMLERDTAATHTLASRRLLLAREQALLADALADCVRRAQELRDAAAEAAVSAAVEQKFVRRETVAHEEAARMHCVSTENRLVEERGVWIKKIELEGLAHDKIMDFLTRQREEVERQVEEWMVKYEQDTESKASAIESIKHERATNVDKFEQLVQMYEELEHAMEEEKRKADDEKKLLMRQIQCARRIQRWWKKILEKKAAAKAKAKKPKGEKKKGKKK